jgi:hypothetical protein
MAAAACAFLAGGAEPHYAPAIAAAYEEALRRTLRPKGQVEMVQIAQRPWKLADGSRGWLLVDQWYVKHARLREATREAVAELVQHAKRSRLYITGHRRDESAILAKVVSERAALELELEEATARSVEAKARQTAGRMRGLADAAGEVESAAREATADAIAVEQAAGATVAAARRTQEAIRAHDASTAERRAYEEATAAAARARRQERMEARRLAREAAAAIDRAGGPDAGRSAPTDGGDERGGQHAREEATSTSDRAGSGGRPMSGADAGDSGGLEREKKCRG